MYYVYQTGSNKQNIVTHIQEILENVSYWRKETSSMFKPGTASVLWCSLILNICNNFGKEDPPSITLKWTGNCKRGGL